jgi:hypothetical protein
MRRPGNSISTGIPNKIELAWLTKKTGAKGTIHKTYGQKKLCTEIHALLHNI